MPAPEVPRSNRTESIEKKVALLQRAYQDNRLDLVASLADSIKDSVQYKRQTVGQIGKPNPGPDDFVNVTELPQAWADWAEGWRYCKPIQLFETVGIQRRREPVELLVGFHGEQITDPYREIRVARMERETSALAEIPSQVLSDGWQQEQRTCRLAFLADVDQHADATYLIFYGNPLAELPDYTTDLQVRGEQWNLDIENEYFIAELSHQMGQLERLVESAA